MAVPNVIDPSLVSESPPSRRALYAVKRPHQVDEATEAGSHENPPYGRSLDLMKPVYCLRRKMSEKTSRISETDGSMT